MLLARHESEDALEIVDEQGTRLGRVTLPTEGRLFGPDKGTVYLKRTPPALPADPPRAA